MVKIVRREADELSRLYAIGEALAGPYLGSDSEALVEVMDFVPANGPDDVMRAMIKVDCARIHTRRQRRRRYQSAGG